MEVITTRTKQLCALCVFSSVFSVLRKDSKHKKHKGFTEITKKAANDWMALNGLFSNTGVNS